jgi:hypothetical protein
MADNDPLEEQPLGSEDPTIMGQPPDDPNATQAEADEPVVLSPEPGAESEGVEEATSELTQEAPLLEELPEEPAHVPQVPAFPIDVKPRSDIYTMMLILSFITFVTVAILAGNEAYNHYDVQFYVFSKENTLTRKPAEGEVPPPDAGPAPAPAPGGGGGGGG